MKLSSAQSDPSDQTENHRNGSVMADATSEQSDVKDPAELKTTTGATNGHHEKMDCENAADGADSNGVDDDVEMVDTSAEGAKKTDSKDEVKVKADNNGDVVKNGECDKSVSEPASDTVDNGGVEGGTVDDSRKEDDAKGVKNKGVKSEDVKNEGVKSEDVKNEGVKVDSDMDEKSQITISSVAGKAGGKAGGEAGGKAAGEAGVKAGDAKSDNDLEKLKSDGGLKMQLDDGETFEVQMISSGDESSGDDEDESSSASSSRPPSATAVVSAATKTIVIDGKAPRITSNVIKSKPDMTSSVTKITIPSQVRAVQTLVHQPTILAHTQVYRDAKGNLVRRPIPVVKSSAGSGGVVNLQPIIVQSTPPQPPKPTGPTNEELAIEFNKNSRKKLTINNLIDALKEFGLDLEYLREDSGKKVDKQSEKTGEKASGDTAKEAENSNDAKKSENTEKTDCSENSGSKSEEDGKKNSEESDKSISVKSEDKVAEKDKTDKSGDSVDDQDCLKSSTKSRSATDSPRRSTRRSSRAADEGEKENESKAAEESSKSSEELKTEKESKSSEEVKTEKESKSSEEVKTEKESKSSEEVKTEKESKSSEEVKTENESKSSEEVKSERKSKASEEESNDKSDSEKKTVEGEKEKESKDSSKAGDKEGDKGKTSESKVDEVVIDSDDEKDKKKQEAEEDKDDDIASHGDVAKKLRPVAKFLYFTGLDFSRESVYHDLVVATDRKHKAGKLDAVEIHDFQQMRKVYHKLRHRNRDLRPRQTQICKRCPYGTESTSVLYLHQLQGHLDDKKVMWSCALCEFESRVVQAFVFHMEAEHNLTAQPLPRPQFFCCSLCSYNSSTKSHMTKHMQKCEKQFVAEKHQFPLYDDINFIFRALPGPLIKVPPPPVPQKMQVRQVVPSSVAGGVTAVGGVNRFVAQPKMMPILPRSGYTRLTAAQLPQMRPAAAAVTAASVQPGRNRYPPQTAQQFITSTIQQMKIVPQAKAAAQPIVIKDSPPVTPQPGVKRPATVANLTAANQKSKSAKYSYEVCEICGGFVLDRQALRLHFAMAHNINLREDALDVTRTPPLACDFCTSRFFTFQGLSLHKARSNHARADQALCHICNTLTSDMPQHIKNAHNIVPNQLNTIRICPICGQCVLTEKTEAHIERVHNIKLEKPVSMTTKPVYTCAQCSAQFTERSLLNLHIRKGHPGTAVTAASATTATAAAAESKKCPLCGALINAGGYNKHVLVAHCRKKLKVKLMRCDDDSEDEDEEMDEDAAVAAVEAAAAVGESDPTSSAEVADTKSDDA